MALIMPDYTKPANDGITCNQFFWKKLKKMRNG